jgi:hypothetical protein
MLNSRNRKEDLHLAFRIFSFESLAFLYIFFGVYDANLKYFFYFTNTGLLLSIIYFFISLLSYKVNVSRLQVTFYLIIWVFNWGITLAYWGYLFPVAGTKTMIRSSILHSYPIILTLVEFFCYHFTIKRTDFFIPLASLLAFLFLLLLPYSLYVRPLYQGIDFQSIISYLICFGLLVIACVMLEVAKLMKDVFQKRKESKLENELILRAN